AVRCVRPAKHQACSHWNAHSTNSRTRSALIQLNFACAITQRLTNTKNVHGRVKDSANATSAALKSSAGQNEIKRRDRCVRRTGRKLVSEWRRPSIRPASKKQVRQQF